MKGYNTTSVKKFNIKKLASYISVGLLSSSVIIINGHAAEPDEIQLQIDPMYQDLYPDTNLPELNGKGAFDLSNEVSTMVSAATKPLVGTSPGIRTIAAVDNDEGQLATCSNISIYYQIIDLDGDWDPQETNLTAPSETPGTTYPHFKTSDTIEWGFKAINGDPNDIIWLDANELNGNVSSNKTTLEIPEKISVNGNEISTEGMTVVYRIKPFTMIGSIPFTNQYEKVFVSDISKGQYLEPGEQNESGDKSETKEHDFFQNAETVGQFTYPGLSLPSGKSFINVTGKEIVAGDKNNCMQNRLKPIVKIYPKGSSLNLLGDKSDPNESIENNLKSKELIFTNDTYEAEIKIPYVNSEGIIVNRSLTRDEFENSPFTWNFYHPLEKQCLQAKWNNPDNQNNISPECLIKESFEVTDSDPKIQSRMKANFITENGIEYLSTASFKLQDNNEDKLFESAIENSEQGSIITVSFFLDN